MEPELNNQQMKDLYKAFVALETESEVKNFMRDLCTLSELKSMSERWQVAKQLKQGISYREISKNTGSSTATITRVAHWVHHGMGGYKLALDRGH